MAIVGSLFSFVLMKQDCIKIIMEGFHQKMMEVMVDNGLRAVQRSKSLVIEKSKLACTALASMFPTFSFATSLISRINNYQ